MAENDIYNSKKKYENFKENLNELLIPPAEKDSKKGRNSKYYCKNVQNLAYFKILFAKMEARDLSFVRRNRLIADMRLIVYVTEKDLKNLERDDIDQIMGFVSQAYPRSKEFFVASIKYVWKLLFPELDERKRIDETLVPYAVRHLTRKVDRSRQKLRGDRFSLDEYEKLINFFNDDAKMQAFLSFSVESLARPQELLYIKNKNIELLDSHAKIWISEHGKEGTKMLFAIDSFQYLIKWYNLHPFKTDPEAYFFVRYDKSNPKGQLSPKNINARIRIASKILGINKPITGYSLKRNGVTFRRLRGDTDVEIQKIAGWTTTKQLRTYDLSEKDDVIKIQLIKRGLLPDTENRYTNQRPQIKVCLYCDTRNNLTDEICTNCKRLLDRNKIRQQEEQNANAMLKLKQAIEILAKNMDANTVAELKGILE